MATFPKLIPAFTARIPIKAPASVGSAKGGLNHVPFVSVAEGHGGSLVSAPGYPLKVDAQFLHGADWIRVDADGKHLRLNVNSILKQKATSSNSDDDDAFLSFTYTGTITVTPEIGKILTGAPDAATTAFGDAFTHVRFESSHPSLAALEHKVYVGAGHFVIEAGQPPIVEYTISEVTV